jgi:hypothetical protein
MNKKTIGYAILAAAIMALVSCGGGGGGSAVVSSSTQISGTAASGAPFASATITLKDANGVTKTATAGADGKFTIDTTGLTAPIVITATGTVGGAAITFVAVAESLSATQTLNVTPLTTAVAALLSDANDPLDMTDITTLKAKVNASDVARVVAALRTVLANVVTSTGSDATTFNPMSSAFTADRTGLDSLLDAIKVTVTSDGVTLTNAYSAIQDSAGDPTASSSPSVVLTKLTIGTPPAPLAAPTVNIATIAKILDKWRDELTSCFARQPADRVTVVSGNVTATKNECLAITGFDAAYKSGGYTLFQRYNDILQASSMTGATFGIPEILSLMKTEAGEDRAIFRLPFKRTDGSSDTIIDVARKIGAATATDSGWRVYGNQRDYDSGVEARIDRGVDLKSGKALYVSGLRIYFAPFGPNASDVTMIRVTGPGLPAAGVVLGKSVTCGSSPFYAILNKTGALTGGTTTNVESDIALDAAYSDGSAFTWPATNVNYAAAPVDLSTLRPLARYKFELYQAGPVLKTTFYAPSLAAPIPAKYGSSLAWNELSAASKLYLDPANAKGAAQTTMSIDWTLTPMAPPVEAAFAFASDVTTPSRVLASAFSIKSNATSATLDPRTYGTGTGVSCATQNFPGIVNTNDMRLIALRSRTRSEVRQHSSYFYQK